MQGIDVKKMIYDEVIKTAARYKKEKGLSGMFLDPIIGYASSKDPLFLIFAERGWSLHPKEIYRPGNSVIVHFLPFSHSVVQSNGNGHSISEEWIAAYESAILFSAYINDSIMKSLGVLGRLTSLTNLPGDWNEVRGGPDWSHKLAAYVAGMGDFSIAESFNTESGSCGRFGSVITDYEIEPSKTFDGENADRLNSIADSIKKSFLFSGSGNAEVCEDKIDLCPAGAIKHDGIDLQQCRSFCLGLGQAVPSSDVCGKCFDRIGG